MLIVFFVKKIDDQTLSNLNLKHLRTHISLVSQEPVLFDASIEENILYGLGVNDVCHEEVVNASKLANIHEFVVSLPEVS